MEILMATTGAGLRKAVARDCGAEAALVVRTASLDVEAKRFCLADGAAGELRAGFA